MRTLVLLLIIAFSLAYNDEIITPPMGWNSWNTFGCKIDETLIVQTIDAMATKLKPFGYQYVNLDDCWSFKTGRNATTKELMPDPTRFPNGIKYLADYAHAKGLKLGIYADIGYKTCSGYPGTYGYHDLDAKTFANWGIDYIKMDFCNVEKQVEAAPWKYYGQFGESLKKTGRQIFYSISNWGVKEPWKWAGDIANSWRTNQPITPEWGRLLEIIDTDKKLSHYSHKGGFNDADVLELDVTKGTHHLEHVEAKSHFTLWSMLDSPLLLGNDIRNIDEDSHKWVKELITNPEVIAVNQDPGTEQAKVVDEKIDGEIKEDGSCSSNKCTRAEVWAKHLSQCQDHIAVAVFNRAGPNMGDTKFVEENFIVTWQALGVDPSITLKVRDLWNKKDLGIYTKEFDTGVINRHDIRLYKFTPV